MNRVEGRDAVIVMETLLDIRRAVRDIHDVVLPPADEDDEDAGKKRKTSREERAAELRRCEDLTPRLEERIDYQAARLETLERAQRERRESS
jgi:hypothetical protein